MNYLKITFITLMVACSFISCKKDDDNGSATPSGSIAGRYTGSYGYGNLYNQYYFSLNLKSNGTLDELNTTGKVVGSGSWDLNGSQFSSTYQAASNPNVYYVVEATYDAQARTLIGTWGYLGDSTYTGHFAMDK